MNALFLSSAVGVVGLAFAVNAVAQTQPEKINWNEVDTDQMYWEADIGAAIQQDVDIQNLNGGGGGTVDFNPGLRCGLVFGYRLSSAFDVELETGVIWNSINKLDGDSLSSFGANADIYEIPMLVNAVYQVPIRNAFKPYLGVGIGGAATVLNSSNVPLGFPQNSTDFTFAYQATAGLMYELGQHVEVGIAYKFLGTTAHTWSDDGVYFKTDGTMTHTILATFTWRF